MDERNAVATSGKTRQFKKVLVVDDDDNWIFVSKLILKKAGIGEEVLTARNGLDALTKLKNLGAVSPKNLPDLIFLDIRMPVMDGFEFLEEAIKPHGLDLSHTKIYMCSSSLNPHDQERASLFPVSGFLTKPLTKESLWEALGK